MSQHTQIVAKASEPGTPHVYALDATKPWVCEVRLDPNSRQKQGQNKQDATNEDRKSCCVWGVHFTMPRTSAGYDRNRQISGVRCASWCCIACHAIPASSASGFRRSGYMAGTSEQPMRGFMLGLAILPFFLISGDDCSSKQAHKDTLNIKTHVIESTASSHVANATANTFGTHMYHPPQNHVNAGQ